VATSAAAADSDAANDGSANPRGGAASMR
jgi:hypothetical protein